MLALFKCREPEFAQPAIDFLVTEYKLLHDSYPLFNNQQNKRNYISPSNKLGDPTNSSQSLHRKLQRHRSSPSTTQHTSTIPTSNTSTAYVQRRAPSNSRSKSIPIKVLLPQVLPLAPKQFSKSSLISCPFHRNSFPQSLPTLHLDANLLRICLSPLSFHARHYFIDGFQRDGNKTLRC